MDVLRRFLSEVEIREEFYSNLELEVLQKCEDRIKKASAADETLSYTMFEFVGELSLLIRNYLSLIEVPENESDKDIEFTRLVGAVVNEAIEGAKGYLGRDSMEESEAGEDIDSNAYIVGCSGASDQRNVSELNLDTSRYETIPKSSISPGYASHAPSYGQHVMKSSSLHSGPKRPNLKYRANALNSSKRKNHSGDLQNPYWASRPNRGVTFDDQGRVVDILDEICPRQRVDATIKLAWNVQANKKKI